MARKPHLCRACGETDPAKFYHLRKNLCTDCRNAELAATRRSRAKVQEDRQASFNEQAYLQEARRLSQFWKARTI